TEELFDLHFGLIQRINNCLSLCCFSAAYNLRYFMRLLICIALLVFWIFPVRAFGASSSIIADHCDFGERYQFEKFDCALHLRNVGENRIKVSNIVAANAADGISLTEATIEAGKSVELTMRVSTGSDSGMISRMVSF